MTSGALTARPHYDRPTTRPGSAGAQRRPGSAGSLYEATRGDRGVGRVSEGGGGRVPVVGGDKGGAPLGSARRDPYAQRLGAQRLPLRTPRVWWVWGWVYGCGCGCGDGVWLDTGAHCTLGVFAHRYMHT